MSCHESQSSKRVIRWPLGLGLLAASASSTAQDFDLVLHNGFEACWSKAITKPQFLDLMKSTADGATMCIPGGAPVIIGEPGFTYEICNTALCPNNQFDGCPVTLRGGTFSGDFGTGLFSGPGSTDNVSMPMTYSDGGATFGTCTISFTSMTQTYSPFFFVLPDGNNGDYMVLAGPMTVMFDTVNASSADPHCSTVIPQLIPMVEQVGSIALTLEFDGNVDGQSVCPLTP